MLECQGPFELLLYHGADVPDRKRRHVRGRTEHGANKVFAFVIPAYDPALLLVYGQLRDDVQYRAAKRCAVPRQIRLQLECLLDYIRKELTYQDVGGVEPSEFSEDGDAAQVFVRIENIDGKRAAFHQIQ